MRRWVARHRASQAAGDLPMHGLPSWCVPSARRAARLLTADLASLSGTDRQFVRTLVALSADIRLAASLANDFARLVRERDAGALDPWLDKAGQRACEAFAGACPQDTRRRAGGLVAALEQRFPPKSFNRLKTIKRQMYGRAKFDLLRSRVLHACLTNTPYAGASSYPPAAPELTLLAKCDGPGQASVDGASP